MFDQEPELEPRQSQAPIGDVDPFFGGGGTATTGDGDGDADGDLTGPGLADGERGFDLTGTLLDEFGAEADGLDGGIPQLDALARKKSAEAEEVAAHGSGDTLQSQWDVEPQPAADTVVAHAAPAATKAKAVEMAPDRDGMRLQIQTAGTKEIQELDEAFAKQVIDLDRRFGAENAKLSTDIGDGKKTVADAGTAADKPLAQQIEKADEGHTAQVTAGTGRINEIGTNWTAALDKRMENDTTVTAGQQVAKIRQDATDRAAKMRAKGRADAAAVRAKAAQARAAAATRAGQVATSEQAAITAAGESRALDVIPTLEADARAIETKAEASAVEILRLGNAEADRIAATPQAANPLAAQSKEQVRDAEKPKISASVRTAKSNLQAVATTAHDEMEKERTAVKTTASTASSTFDTKSADEQKAAAEKEAKLRTDTIEKLKSTLASEKKKVSEKTAKLLKDLDKTKDKDLAKVSKKLGKELYELDQTDANTAMKKLVKRADKSHADDIAKRRKAVKAQVEKAKAAIAKAAKAAKKNITKIDTKAKKDIGKAARDGAAQVRKDGDAALQAQADAKRARREVEWETSDVDVSVEESNANSAIDALRTKQDDHWAAAAVTEAGTALDGGKPIAALNLLTSLTPEAQGKAIDTLPQDKFDALIANTPAARQDEFKSLIKHTTDPQRKLLLWEKFHYREVVRDWHAKKGDIGPEDDPAKTAEQNAAARTPAQQEAYRLHKIRENFSATTLDEITEEANFLKNEPSFDASDVDALMERKDMEHQMELKYNLNITNKAGKRADGSKIIWDKAQLAGLESSFAQLPEEHAAGNKLLKELHRSDVYEWNGKKETDTGGTHSGGVIAVYDSGMDLEGDGYRHGGDKRELASPYICGKCGTKITVLDMVVTHEIGHDIHDQNTPIFDKFKQINGWDGKTKAQLEAEGLSKKEIKELEKTREDNYSGRHQVHKNGKIYMVDPYGSGFLVVDETAIPDKGEAKTGANGTDDDTWGYARSNYKDHFAEMYAKAVHAPLMLHSDLVEGPQQRLDAATTKQDRAKRRLDMMKAGGADQAEIDEAQKRFDAADAELKNASAEAQKRGDTFNLMRNEVFHTNDAQSEAETRLRAAGKSDDEINAFKAEAAKASTPEQIKTIEARY